MMQEDGTPQADAFRLHVFDQAKECNHYFSCIGLIHQEDNRGTRYIFEAAKLLDYKGIGIWCPGYIFPECQ